MNDLFQRRVRSAAVAGWWTIFIAILFLLIQWVAYLALMNFRPGWMLFLFGPNIDWPFIEIVWFWMMAIFKVVMWVLILVALWLTLWARQLRKD